MFCALLIPDFRLHAALRYRAELWERPVAIVDAEAVVEQTAAAENAGVRLGMSPPQALARCLDLQLLNRTPAAERTLLETLLGIACGASAYVEQTAENIATLDLQGLRVTDFEPWGTALAGRLTALQIRARAGIAENPDIALLAARSVADGCHVVRNSTGFLAALPLETLWEGDAAGAPAGLASILHGWGIRTVGGLTRLKKSDVAARLGPEGVRLWERGRGRTKRLLRLVRPLERYEEAFDFEGELDTALPLLFLLRRFVDALTARLEAVGLVVSELRLTLPLSDGSRYERLFRIPSPTARADVLFRVLDTHFENLRLEHSPTGVRLTAEPAKPEHCQFRLFENAVRDPNRFAETLARLMAVVGGDNVGVPEMKSTHRPDQFSLTMPWLESRTVTPTPEPGPQAPQQKRPASGLPLRRYRPPLPAQVHAERGRPRYVVSDQAHGTVVDVLGPYRLSGDWWENGWSVEEWDIQVAAGGLYRLSRHGETWQLEGAYERV